MPSLISRVVLGQNELKKGFDYTPEVPTTVAKQYYTFVHTFRYKISFVFTKILALRMVLH